MAEYLLQSPSVTMPVKRTYRVNEGYFDSIDSEGKAYWLGFLFADGSLEHIESEWRWRLKVNIGLRDVGHLLKLKKAIGAEQPIRGYVNNAVSLTIVSRRLVETLSHYIPFAPKTNPQLPNLPNDLFRHFVRGYFDGDGFIWQGRRKRDGGLLVEAGIVGPHDFLVALARVVCQQTGVKDKAPRRNGSIYTVSWSSVSDFRVLCRYLYDDSTVSLDRKQKAFNRIVLQEE